jgi:hypothetical protein
LTGYIIEKRLATTHKWERVATVDTSVTLHTLENLKEKCQYYFRYPTQFNSTENIERPNVRDHFTAVINEIFVIS